MTGLETIAAAASWLWSGATATAAAFIGVATVMNTVLILTVGVGIATAAAVAISDRRQKEDVIRHNFPLIGRLLPALNWFGQFSRNHLFASDREELPFNRSQRDAVYNFAKGKLNVGAFGSTKNLKAIGSYFFPNAQFFKETKSAPVVIGPDTKHPYVLKSVFNVSAMSYGSISEPAVKALSRGANAAECLLDTGEGGLAPAHLEGNADLVFEIGTAKFGVRDAEGNLDTEKLKKIAANDQVRMISVKLAQGAKPGEGGRLPAKKVTIKIAEIRGIPVGVDAESPDQHKDIKSVPELLDFIKKVKDMTGKPVGFKTIYSRPEDVQELCTEIKKRDLKDAPDFIVLDGGEGGSGSAPEVLMDNVGMSIRDSLPMVKEVLIENELHERVRIGASGKLILPEDVAWALAMGADFVNSARGFLMSMGCVMAMRCNKDTCPTGLTTNNPDLQKGFNPEDKGVRVANYAKGIVAGVESIAHACGLENVRQLRPEHVLMVQEQGKPVAMNKVYPKLKF